MSYKLNVKNPQRKETLRKRREKQHSMLATLIHKSLGKFKLIDGEMIFVRRNKYILSGPDKNIRDGAK